MNAEGQRRKEEIRWKTVQSISPGVFFASLRLCASAFMILLGF
jgi:hypothetical protein